MQNHLTNHGTNFLSQRYAQFNVTSKSTWIEKNDLQLQFLTVPRSYILFVLHTPIKNTSVLFLFLIHGFVSFLPESQIQLAVWLPTKLFGSKPAPGFAPLMCSYLGYWNPAKLRPLDRPWPVTRFFRGRCQLHLSGVVLESCLHFSFLFNGGTVPPFSNWESPAMLATRTHCVDKRGQFLSFPSFFQGWNSAGKERFFVWKHGND